jgi:tetrahydromethanopterin S-methyltransferase subunit F
MFAILGYVNILDQRITFDINKYRGQILARKLKNSTHKSQNTVSKGGIAGIVIAVVIVILILILVFIYLRKRRVKRAAMRERESR